MNASIACEFSLSIVILLTDIHFKDTPSKQQRPATQRNGRVALCWVWKERKHLTTNQSARVAHVWSQRNLHVDSSLIPTHCMCTKFNFDLCTQLCNIYIYIKRIKLLTLYWSIKSVEKQLKFYNGKQSIKAVLERNETIQILGP